MNEGQMMRLVHEVSADRDRALREKEELPLGILAEEGAHRIMGTPVEFVVRWPEGPPPGFADADAVRQWARDRLAELRGAA